MILKIKYLLQLVLFCTVFVTLFSCGKESSCFKSTGKIISEQRVITNQVNVINMEDNIDLVITQSAEESLRVEGGANLLSYVNTEVSGNELSISSDNRCAFFRDYSIPLTVYLSIPNIEKINYTGQGTINSTDTLKFPNFSFETNRGTGSINLIMSSDNISVVQNTGPADITFSGVSKKLYLYSGGNGWFYLNKLRADDVHVNNSGTGDFIITANNILLVELKSIGNIDYYGSPNVTISVHSGSGKLRKK